MTTPPLAAVINDIISKRLNFRQMEETRFLLVLPPLARTRTLKYHTQYKQNKHVNLPGHWLSRMNFNWNICIETTWISEGKYLFFALPQLIVKVSCYSFLSAGRKCRPLVHRKQLINGNLLMGNKGTPRSVPNVTSICELLRCWNVIYLNQTNTVTQYNCTGFI